jgi:peptidylprolyl isomerase
MLKIPFFLAAVSSLIAQESESGSTQKNEEVAKISEAMGHLIGKNLQALGLPLDIDALVRGMHEAAEGKESPLSEEECVLALSSLQEESAARAAEKNLAEANDFLKKNRERKEIVSLVEGKLQYEVVKPGGGQTVQPYNAPMVRYKGRYLNGPSIPASEELIDLEEAIPGFSKALVGMKEGESRTLYIHPDLGYGKQAPPPPNALLIFEVEIVKADASSEAHAASNTESLPLQPAEDEALSR